MEVILGILIIALGSLGQSSSYVPIKKVKLWNWENFWLVQGIFAWLIFPILGTLFALPEGLALSDVYTISNAWKPIFFGVLWGVGGLTFGLSMRYLGVALGQSISLGTCSAFGTLFPALFAGINLFHGNGLILLLGVIITLIGISVIGYAGWLRSKNIEFKEINFAEKEFKIFKGLIVALIAGLMSACFALGLDAGEEIKTQMISQGCNKLLAGLPVILLVTFGGFLTNAVYCIFQHLKNKSFPLYYKVSANLLFNNVLLCALAGLLWYSQFFGLEIGRGFLVFSPVLLAFSWSILMSLNVLFSNLWGIVLKEWRHCRIGTYIVLCLGLGILIFSVFFSSLF